MPDRPQRIAASNYNKKSLECKYHGLHGKADNCLDSKSPVLEIYIFFFEYVTDSIEGVLNTFVVFS
jgi:hypothetical protein